MHLRNAAVLTASVLVALCHASLGPARAQQAAGVRVRVEALKRSTFPHKAAGGPVFVGPQSAFELEWRVLNNTGGTLEIVSPDAVLRLRVTAQGRDLPVRTDWAPQMTVRSPVNGELVPATLPLGSAALADGASLWVRGSTKLVDGSAFAPGDYVLELEVSGRQMASAGARTLPTVDRGFPIQASVLDLNSPERLRQFHMIEAAFYKPVDRTRALEHYTALASLPGAPWSDSLPLAWLYGDLGRHQEAALVYRRILPDLIRALDSPLGETLRKARHIRRAAMSLAVEGDTAGAANLLRIEGETPETDMPRAIQQLRNSAPKAGANPK